MQSSNKSQVSVATSLDFDKRRVIQSYSIFDRNNASVHGFVLEIQRGKHGGKQDTELARDLSHKYRRIPVMLLHPQCLNRSYSNLCFSPQRQMCPT